MEDWLGVAVKQFTLTSTPRKRQVALLDLPPGVPETAHVTLSDGSTKGLFIIRTKTVVDEHFTEHTLTSFLRKSGVKGGWKTAIWISTAGGGMVLHTWLSQRKLTLAMLGELAKNAKAAGWQRPLLPGEVEFRRGKAHGQNPEGSQASRPTASRRSSLSARPLHDDTEAAPKTASLRHLAMRKASDTQLQAPMRDKTALIAAPGSLAWQGGAALKGLAAANAKDEGHGDSQHAATPSQHMEYFYSGRAEPSALLQAMQALSSPPINTGPPQHYDLGVPHIMASLHSVSPPADIQPFSAHGHALEAQDTLPVLAAAPDHDSLPPAKSLDHDAESQGFIAARCASPATDTAYAHDMSAAPAGAKPAGWLSFLQSEAPVNEPELGSASTAGDPRPAPRGMGLMAGAALQPRPAPQPQRQAASLLTLPSVRKLITSGGRIAGAQRGVLLAQPSSNLTRACYAMQRPLAAAATGHTLQRVPVSQKAVEAPHADSARHLAPPAEACQPRTLHAAGDQHGGLQHASLKACLLGMLVADLHNMGQERPSAQPVLWKGGAADGAHGAPQVPEDLRQNKGASLPPSTTTDADACAPHMQAVEEPKEPHPDSDALSCQRKLAGMTVVDKQDGATPSSNNTTIMPFTLAANISRCLALKRKEPDAPDEAAMRQELTKRFKGLLKAKTASEAFLLQMEGRVTKLEAEKEAVVAQAQKEKARMKSALQQGQDELCQLAASKDALQRAHTELAAAHAALQDQHERMQTDHERALQAGNLYNEVRTAFNELARTSGAQIAELRAACTNDHEQKKQSLQQHYAACMGLGIEALRKELRLEVMREIMEDTESLGQAGKRDTLTRQPGALQTA